MLDDRHVPTIRSRIHMHWRRRNWRLSLIVCLKRHRVVHHEFFQKGQSSLSSIDKPYSSEKLAVVNERRDLLEPLELLLALWKLIMLLWQQWVDLGSQTKRKSTSSSRQHRLCFALVWAMMPTRICLGLRGSYKNGIGCTLDDGWAWKDEFDWLVCDFSSNYQPKFRSSSRCPIPFCAACKLICAKKQ